jgi:Uma2 family endonuclease
MAITTRTGLHSPVDTRRAKSLGRGTATIDDLYRVEGKAELINGHVVQMAASGFRPSRVSLRLSRSLDDYERAGGSGYAIGDNAGFRVRLPHRESFSPDAAWYTGPDTGMKFLDGAPAFAAEVRSENGYDPAAERELRDKRADYFAAGTLVVWDVDPLEEETIRVYRGGNPDTPAVTYRRGDVAEAKPAVPGWRVRVDDLFR